MTLSLEGVVSASYLMAILTFGLTSVILLIFNVLYYLVGFLSALAAILVYYVMISYPTSVMNSYKLSLSEEADMVFEQFILTFQAGRTIFDAIEMVAQSEHPFLSQVFQQMLSRIERGVSPETCISEFAKNQPSEDLRRYLVGILSALEQKTDLLEMLSGESFEADLALRQKNLELESRLLIVAALATYLPIMLTLAISLSGFATNPLVLLIAPAFISLNALLTSRFSRQFSAYFDRPRDSGIIAPSQREIIEEYDEFLNFLILLGERLRLGDNLEVALTEVREDVTSEVQRIIDPVIDSIYDGSKGTSEAMQRGANLALGQRVSYMMNMVSIMCETSARDAGDRITKIAARLVKRSSVAKERDSIIAAQKLKVYLLSLTSALVLGLLGSLSPFLNLGGFLSEGPIWTPGSFSLIDITPLLLTLFLITTTTGYQNTRMVSGSRALLIGLLCGLLFLVTFFISASIMGFSTG
jgi:Flp pilus assembly protein TadB